MTGRARWRSRIEPAALFGASLVGSAALWGRLWVTSPRSRGICGCGDPSLFQWFLGWPAHAIATGHSLFFSRDLFHPAGVNLLSNTSVLGLGVPLAPVTWLGGPVLTENVALLLAVPVAALTMDLFLRRVSASLTARVVLSLLYAFSPYVIASLAVSHLMTAWIGVLPLIALGAVDALSDDARRARRGAVLLGCAVVAQFFVSTELLLLAVIVACVFAAAWSISWVVTRTPTHDPRRAVRRLGVPVVVAAVVLAAPTAYALFGPRSLPGNIWGPGFNPGTGGTSAADLVRPHVVAAGLTALSGYVAPVIQLQFLGWGLLVVAALVAAWQWRDAVVRASAITVAACLVLSLSPTYVSWAPWQWIGKLPVLENVLQFRIAVFAMFFCIVVIARGVSVAERLGTVGVVAGAVALAAVVLPVAIPEASGLPLRTVHVAVPRWWRDVAGPGVVLAYPYPGVVLQSPLTWQAKSQYAVSMLGGSGPQGALLRAGVDAPATAVLDALSNPQLAPSSRPTATPQTAGLVRSMVVRDGVTAVVVPVSPRGRPLVTGAPSVGAAAFFIQALGTEPAVERGAWVFHVGGALPEPRYATAVAVTACEAATSPQAFAACVHAAGTP